MAFIASNFGMTVSYMDGGSNVVTREYTMDDDIATYADAETEAVAMLARIVPLTTASIPEYRVFQIKSDDAVVIPPSTVQVENTASLTLLLAVPGNKKANLNIPAPVIEMFVAATGPQANVVNSTYAALVTFTNSFLAAGKFTISDGENTRRLLSGKRTHKKSNKG